MFSNVHIQIPININNNNLSEHMESVVCVRAGYLANDDITVNISFPPFVQMVCKLYRTLHGLHFFFLISSQAAVDSQEERELGQSIWRSRFCLSFFLLLWLLLHPWIQEFAFGMERNTRKALFYFFPRRKRENNHIFVIRNGLIKAIIVMSWCQQSRRRSSQPFYWRTLTMSVQAKQQ